MKFKKQIEKIFGKIKRYQELVNVKTIYFDTERCEISYDKLTELSNLLGTTRINFTGTTETIMISSVTTDTEEWGEIKAWDVKF